jgi:hypothetical protein
MKQQGWLSKIVPQPSEATVPCLHGARRGPWGGSVVAEQILMMRYQCLQDFISIQSLRRNP